MHLRVLIPTLVLLLSVAGLAYVLTSGGTQAGGTPSEPRKARPGPKPAIGDSDALIAYARNPQVGRVESPPAAPSATLPVSKFSPLAKDLPGLTRQCDDARSFTVYGAELAINGEKLQNVAASCERPPTVVDGRLPEPTRENQTVLFYGPCRGAGESGCSYDYTVLNRPSCEAPHRRFHLDNEFDLPNLQHEDILVRGVPAMIYNDGMSAEIYTKETTVAVFAPNRKRTLDLLNKLVPAGSGRNGSLAVPDEAVASPTAKGPVACAS